MQRNEVASGLRAFLEREFPNQGVDLSDNTDLLQDWFVDSLGIVQTVMFIESEFEVSITRADINGENFKSIATMADFITRRLS